MNTEEKKKYFAEAALALDREGFRAEMFHDGKLSVWWDGAPLCEVSDGGTVHYHSSELQTPERNEAKDKAYQITCTVFEYMRLMEPAPPLKVADLSDRCKGCPYPSHGFICWSENGQCMREFMKKT